LTGKYARSATAGSQPLSVTDVEKYYVKNAVFLNYGATAAAMAIRKHSAKPVIMIPILIYGEPR
jgi:hypothetical protein